MTFADAGDDLLIRANPDGPPIGMEIDGLFGDELMAAAPQPSDNIVVKAAAGLRTLAERAGHACTPVYIRLTKNLPVAAGLGGGSADAAAAIAGLSRLWDLPARLPERHHLVTLLGADVAMCLAGRPLRATGLGDKLEEVAMPALDLVLVNPHVAVATPDVFAREEKLVSGSQDAIGEPLMDHLHATRNDLEPAARAIAPVVGEVLDTLARTDGCRLARMSGSGATCFALYDDAGVAEAAAEAVRTARPAWWCVATRTVSR